MELFSQSHARPAHPPLVRAVFLIGVLILGGILVVRGEHALDTPPSASYKLLSSVSTGALTLVRFQVENVTKDQIDVAAPELRDSQDRMYTALVTPAVAIPRAERCGATLQLNPSLPRICQYAYELPANDHGLTLVAQDATIALGQ